MILLFRRQAHRAAACHGVAAVIGRSLHHNGIVDHRQGVVRLIRCKLHRLYNAVDGDREAAEGGCASQGDGVGLDLGAVPRVIPRLQREGAPLHASVEYPEQGYAGVVPFTGDMGAVVAVDIHKNRAQACVGRDVRPPLCIQAEPGFPHHVRHVADQRAGRRVLRAGQRRAAVHDLDRAEPLPVRQNGIQRRIAGDGELALCTVAAVRGGKGIVSRHHPQRAGGGGRYVAIAVRQRQPCAGHGCVPPRDGGGNGVLRAVEDGLVRRDARLQRGAGGSPSAAAQGGEAVCVGVSGGLIVQNVVGHGAAASHQGRQPGLGIVIRAGILGKNDSGLHLGRRSVQRVCAAIIEDGVVARLSVDRRDKAAGQLKGIAAALQRLQNRLSRRIGDLHRLDQRPLGGGGGEIERAAVRRGIHRRQAGQRQHQRQQQREHTFFHKKNLLLKCTGIVLCAFTGKAHRTMPVKTTASAVSPAAQRGRQRICCFALTWRRC